MELKDAPRYIQRAQERIELLQNRIHEDLQRPWRKNEEAMLDFAVDEIHQLHKQIVQYWKVTGAETHKGGIDNPNHDLEVTSYRLSLDNPQVNVKCKVCHQEFDRAATEEEAKEIKDRWEDTHSLHTLWHEIKRELDGANTAGDMEDVLDSYVSKYPDAVWRVGVDDSHHASSDIYIISHKDPKSYWGFTCIYVGQCDDGFAQFFLYPNHLRNMIDTLNKIDNLVQEAG